MTAVQLFRHRDADPAVEDNRLVAAARRVLPISAGYDGNRIVTRAGGRRVFTPLLLALLAIGSTDVLFAVDSIPAVFGVTQHAYIVFVANAFALLGLRALYFLVSGALDRLVYLSTGLAVILAFIGVKLVLEFAHLQHPAVPEISTGLSLVVIGVVLAVTTLASLDQGPTRSERPRPRGSATTAPPRRQPNNPPARPGPRASSPQRESRGRFLGRATDLRRSGTAAPSTAWSGGRGVGQVPGGRDRSAQPVANIGQNLDKDWEFGRDARAKFV